MRWLFMTIYKQKKKQKKKHRYSDTFCIDRSAFLFCFYGAY